MSLFAGCVDRKISFVGESHEVGLPASSRRLKFGD